VRSRAVVAAVPNVYWAMSPAALGNKPTEFPPARVHAAFSQLKSDPLGREYVVPAPLAAPPASKTAAQAAAIRPVCLEVWEREFGRYFIKMYER
jgi:hypothetical protein